MALSPGRHKAAMQKQKARVDAGIREADTSKGVCVFLTGNGKGKTTSAFGMVLRALGYGQRVGIVQFIKGQQKSGEELYMETLARDGGESPLVFHQMGTGFTWETQDRDHDTAAAEKSWQVAGELLSDASVDLVVLDELTYMLAFKYLDEEKVASAIENRPRQQSVVITGRGGGARLKAIADTVSEVKEIKHAYREGIQARKGVDY